VSRSAGFGEAPQQAFLPPPAGAKIVSVYTLTLLAESRTPGNPAVFTGGAFLRNRIVKWNHGKLMTNDMDEKTMILQALKEKMQVVSQMSSI